MKKIIIAAVLIMGIGCKEKKELPPSVNLGVVEVGPVYKAVHNKCTGTWALNVSQPWYGTTVLVYYMGMPRRGAHGEVVNTGSDSGFNATIGGEYIFKDSLSAASALGRYLNREKASKEEADKIARIKDSIFKCQHTYE
jgi:hypothetical protein